MTSIREAAASGIERLRKPTWANPFDHVKLDIIGGGPGPWLHLWCPFNKECNGRDPVDMLLFLAMDLEEKCFVAYGGPLETSDEYKAECTRFLGVLDPAK